MINLFLLFLQKSIPVLVKVIDINDNVPKFTQEIYTVNVSEVNMITINRHFEDHLFHFFSNYVDGGRWINSF